MPRLTLAALPLLALAAPLPAAAADPDGYGAATILNDPYVQDRVADNVAGIVGAIMNVNIGPLAEAVARIDPYSDAAYIPPDATLGEVAGDGDPYVGERLGDEVRAATRVAGRAVGALATYAPVLRHMARDMAAQWDRQLDEARR